MESRLEKPHGAARKWMGNKGTRQAIGLAASIVLLTSSAAVFSASDANYTYDALGRLAKVAYSDGGQTTTITYSYDAAGNRTSVVSISPS
ncbi:RHS repeat protein [Paraburkholderia sediminicola]|uniref:RHS repeat domain-containing protein n=1 Tax=Paraburkholderia TaxID=1822464 RepID=UPI0038B8948F